MISVAFFLLCGLDCLIPVTNGIYHYGVEDTPDVASPGEVDIVVIFHGHPKRFGSSSEDSSESSSASSSFESDSSDSSDSSSISARSHSHSNPRHPKFTRSVYSSGSSSDSDFSSSISDSVSTESGSRVFPPRHSAGHSSGSGYSRFSTGTSSPNRSVRPPVSRTNGRRLGAGSFGSTTERDSDDESDDELIIRFTAFGELIKVKLRQTRSTVADSTTPVYYTESSKSASEVTLTKLPENALARAIKIYQDEKTESSLLVGRDEYGDTFFLGVVAGYNIRRHPLRSGRRNPQRSSINELEGSDYHIVSKISRKRREMMWSYAGILESRFKRHAGVKNIVYPEILVATDYDLKFSSTSSREIFNHLNYVLAFFNGLDLIFKQLSDPKVQLHISAIVIGGDRGAMPYIHDNLDENGTINATKALDGTGPFFASLLRNEEPAASYDIIATLTDQYICDEHEADICTPLIAGVTSVQPVCQNNSPIVNMVTIIEDNLAFSGLRIAAHEVGHLLGAGHDGDEDEGGGDCDFDEGYIMSKYNENSTVSLTWSKCSRARFTEELNKAYANCVRNVPENKDDLPKILPGSVKDLHAQCQTLGYQRACLGPEVCQSILCTNDTLPFPRNCEKPGAPAAQGSTCTPLRHCINGHCVGKFG